MDGSFIGERIDLFALVAYLPEPLAGFVNAVRRELDPACRLRAHITILPPRELSCDPEAASREIQRVIGQARAFRVSIGPIKVFPRSEVIHLSIDEGMEPLRELHGQLNQGCAKAPELWPYHPHVTLAQDLEPAAVAAATDLAVRRWREYSGPRSFALEHLTFVRQTLHSKAPAENGSTKPNPWVDIQTWELPSHVLA
jgi:2'-5' RNA ligase